MSKLSLEKLKAFNASIAAKRTPLSKTKGPQKTTQSAPKQFLMPASAPYMPDPNLFSRPPAPSREDVEASCPAVCALAQTGGEKEAEWSLVLINVAKFTADPEDSAKSWSSNYPGYDPVEVTSKLEAKMRASSGPTSCARIAELDSSAATACDSCSYRGRVSGPIHAAQKYAANKASLFARTSPNSPFETWSALDFTDAGNAAWLHHCFNNRVRFVTELRCWLFFETDFGWSKQTDAKIIRLAELAIRKLGTLAMGQLSSDQLKRLSSHVAKSLSAAGLANAVSLLKGQPGVEVKADELDADPMLLGLRDGRGIDLKLGIVFDLEPHHLVTKSIGCQYDEHARCPQWDKFLLEVFEQQQGLIDYIQTWAGYCLTGIITEQQILFGFGIGANGKSVLFKVLRTLFGGYAATAPVETFMLSAGEGPKSFLLARLAGARFVLANETAEGQRLAENTIKELSGGERITSAHKYGHPFEYDPCFKIAIVGNHKPVIRGTDTGIWRRLHLLPFNRIFTKDEQDPDLTSKLIEEHPGILNWALEGLKKWQKSQLSLPKIMQIEVETYRTESDVIGLWLSEKCETGRTLTATAEDLYRSYNFWCECNGHHPGNQTRLGRQLSERGFTKEKSARVTWRGLAVKKLPPGEF